MQFTRSCDTKVLHPPSDNTKKLLLIFTELPFNLTKKTIGSIPPHPPSQGPHYKFLLFLHSDLRVYNPPFFHHIFCWIVVGFVYLKKCQYNTRIHILLATNM